MADPSSQADLYGLDLSAFTAARDALAKGLRTGGDRREAERVKKLRRPSLTAWALNQAARRRPDLVTAALGAGATLRAATRQAIDGDASAVRPAQVAERSAVDGLVSVAGGILEAAGHQAADAARMRMAQTVRAAFVDDDLAGQLRRGVLDRDHQATGLGLEDGFEPSAPRPVPAAADPVDADRPTDDEAGGTDELGRQRAKKRAADLSRGAEEFDRRVNRLRGDTVRAERDATEARQTAEQASRRAAEARQAADEAARRAADAEQRAAESRQRAADRERAAVDARHTTEAAELEATDARRQADQAARAMEAALRGTEPPD